MKRKSMLFALCLLPLASLADDKKLSQVPDQEFFDKAAVAGLFEVRASELALQRGVDSEVKSFAQMMVTDHTANSARLKSLAMTKGAMLPAELDKDHRKDLEKLRAAKQGKDFDETYADMMEDGHDKAVKLFSKTAEGAKDSDVRRFAAESLPTLKLHNEQAEKLDAKDMKAAGA